MNSSTFVGNSDGLVTGLCPGPPPPPPPPPVPGQVPAMRINTAEAPAIKRPQIVSNDGYEPPAAIQNAMLTKDKKPFTYTPGMGGKLDLSQIRSPRMARRVAKNANDEGIEGPPKSALEPKPTPALNPGANLFVQPQVAVPVFPTNVPPQPSANRTPPTPPVNRVPSIVSEKQPEPAKNVIKPDAKVTQIQVTSSQPSSPESPSTPTQVTLTKAPTPWLQNKNKPQEELPEWAKRSSKQSSSPESPIPAPVYTPVQQTQPPQWQPVQQKQQPMQQRPQSQQFQYQQEPQVYNQQPQPQQYNQQQQKRAYTSPTAVQPTSPQERVVPIRIEDRPSVFDVKHEPGHHQFKQPPSTHHQQRWGQSPNHNQIQVQHQPSTPQAQQSAGGSYIIPIMVEGSEKKSASGTGPNVYSQPTVRNNTMENQTTKVIQRGPTAVQQTEPGPVQSRSFRVLQKITDTDVPNDVDTEQIRKLQLTEDDRILMNKFKEQVDSDTYLHQEEDPRYRGAAIPSRAFRFLQTMTDSGETPVAPASSRGQNAINKKQNRNSKSFEESQANLPPSEQQVQEPKKYMGSAIPSRSFRILQAMTAPESVATQENHQADYTCQTENNVPGNQQGVFLPPCSPPFWNPEGAWWGYYPLPYQNLPNNDPQQTFDHYPYQPDGTAYIYYPIYNQNYAGYTQYNPLNGDKNAYTNVYPQYIIPSSVQSNENHFNPNYGQSNNCVMIPNNDPGSKLPDNRVRGHEGKVASETCNLNPLPQWTSNVSRTTSSNSNKDSDCTTAMNITDEEEIPETVVTPRIVEGTVLNSEDVEKKACPSGGLNVNVLNYSYIDSSDSSDSTDSESNSDNESIIESSKISSSSTSTSDSSSSDSDDSDSYLAYSTGLNPHGRYEDNERNGATTCSSKGTCDDRLETESSSVNNNSTDCESDSEEQIEQEVESSKTDTTFPHQLSVIYEDVEHADSESPRPQDNKDVRKWNETPFEATDDPPDEADTTTVSVSLPLRFKFSVSENNEDVTTVIVGDSTIKPERSCNKDDGRCSTEHRGANEKINVPANYQVNNDTSVNFTLKKERLENKRIAKSLASEKVLEEIVESKEEKGEDALIPHVNFTLRKNPSRMNNINCEETVDTEFTIRHKKISSRKENVKVEKDQEECSVSTNTSTHSSNSSVITVSKGESSTVVSIDDANYADKSDEIDFQTHDFNKNVVKPEVVVSECNWGGDSKKVCSKNPSSTIERELSEKDEIHVENDSNISSKHRNDDDRGTEVKDKLGNEAKHLLSVQNSREETDDEDSGVTSDMSRMISEVDTDSECTSSRNMRKYQRTQTHSRLFKLLNDDSVLPGGNERNNDSSSRREYLSLPLKTNGFNYDENYCSNYSSGLTSPEYSPICEQSWRRLHEGESNGSAVGESRVDHNGDVPRHGHPLSRQERVSCKEDPYYQAWKTSKSPGPCEHDVLPSLAFKILENRRPFWAYKVNVLCPRIKSTKSVPQTLQTNKTTDSTVHPNPSSYVNLRTDHC